MAYKYFLPSIKHAFEPVKRLQFSPEHISSYCSASDEWNSRVHRKTHHLTEKNKS